MNAKLLMVGVGCGVTLIGVNHETNQLPVQQRTFATAAQSIVARRPLAMETAILFPDAGTRPDWRTRFPARGSEPDWRTRFPDRGNQPGSRTRLPDLGSQPDRPPYITPPFNPPSAPPVTLDWRLPPDETWQSKTIRQLQALASHPRDAIAGWDQPWRGIAGFALDLVELAVKLLVFAAVVAAAVVAILVVGQLCRVAYSALSPKVKQVHSAIEKDPAPMRTVVSVGLGSGFSLLIGLALFQLWQEDYPVKALELGTVIPIACGVVAFIDPLRDWVKARLGLEPEHNGIPHKQEWPLHGLAIAVLVITVLIHGLLDKSLKEQPAQSLLLIATAFILPAAITYAWIAGARQRQSRAALYGAVAGAALGAAALVAVYLIDPSNTAKLEPLTKFLYIVTNALQWGIVGLVGGAFVARPWGGLNPVRCAAVTVLGTLVLMNLLLTEFIVHVPYSSELFVQSLFRAGGWAGGLVAVEWFALRCLPAENRVTLTAAHAPA